MVGDYWDVMPAVFFGRSYGLDLIPVTYRSLAISRTIGTRLADGVPAYCISNHIVCNKMSKYAGDFFVLDSSCQQNCFMQVKRLTKKDFSYEKKGGGDILINSGDLLPYKFVDGFIDPRVLSISGVSIPDTYGVWSDANSGLSCVEIMLNDSYKNKIVKMDLILEPYKNNNLIIKTAAAQDYINLKNGLGTYYFEGPLGNEGLVRLCPTRPMRPIDLNENADSRLLGIFINRISLR